MVKCDECNWLQPGTGLAKLQGSKQAKSRKRERHYDMKKARIIECNGVFAHMKYWMQDYLMFVWGKHGPYKLK